MFILKKFFFLLRRLNNEAIQKSSLIWGKTEPNFPRYVEGLGPWRVSLSRQSLWSWLVRLCDKPLNRRCPPDGERFQVRIASSDLTSVLPLPSGGVEPCVGLKGCGTCSRRSPPLLLPSKPPAPGQVCSRVLSPREFRVRAVLADPLGFFCSASCMSLCHGTETLQDICGRKPREP